MTKFLLSTSLVLLSFGYAAAQQHRFSITPEYNIPIGDMASAYKASPGAQLNFSFVNTDNSKVLKCSGISVGYTTMQPAADILYYETDQGDLGTAIYGPFKMLMVKGTLDFSFSLNKKMSFQMGGGLGLTYGMRDMEFHDSYNDDYSSEIAAWAILTPKAGFEFILNEHISLVPGVTYTAMIRDSFYHYYSPNLSIDFLF